MHTKEKVFRSCSNETARKKLLLGDRVDCVNVTSQGYVKERVKVETVEQFDKIHKNYKHYVWAVK